MTSYILRRLAWMIPTLFGITLVVFVAVHAAPGDPAFAHGLGDAADVDLEARAAILRAEHLLDQPLWKQYLHFLGPFDLGASGHRAFGGTGVHPWNGLLALDFGREFQRADVDVASEIGKRLCVTVPLALASLVFTYFVALPLGVWCAARNGRRRERAVSIGLFALHAVPAFWLALLLILFFGASGLGWLPVLGLHGKDSESMGTAARVIDVVRHALLPVLALSLGSLAYLSRQVKSGVLGVMREDFMRTARAKGLSERDALVKHGLRNALLPVITLAGSVLPALVGGSVIVEAAFGIEGIGRYAYEGMLQRDFNIVLATTTLSAALTLLGILAADVAYALADPRVRMQARRAVPAQVAHG